ncbi:hypothetical protein FSP39_000035 [Pinctada imbricata]|uniref:Actin interacting protein 3-like C-terminal domain-containing protein n=1 Tax=Pinctada imbricata TaxID=66713 RepID=A0AA88YUL6_PINIB|nr:hypothetical protein FSP39_000035 [Pinctada imbricata]
MMKDSILGCLWGGFSTHSRSCDNGFSTDARERSPHERHRDSSPGTVTCSWGQGRRGQKKTSQDSDTYKRIERPREVSAQKRRPAPAKRPRYILDLKTDTCYLETDLDLLEKSRSFESTDSGVQSSWNTGRSRSRIIETEADIHREGSDAGTSPGPLAIAIGPNGEHVQYQPIRGILKKSLSYQPQPGDEVRKRDAFINVLSKRYPQYADKITGTGSEENYSIRSSRRPRDPQRRATLVTYNPSNERAVEFDDGVSETMSNIEGPVAGFQRGGWMRNSMPIVRSPPNTYDRRVGVVFLVMGSETKKAELPTEITHLDTVRAMFVRSFPGKLSMEYLESPRRKIYILDPVTNIYYQLEDLRDIKDRTVLRLYECDSDDPQKVKDPPPETRGKMVLTPRDDTPPIMYPDDTPATAITDKVRKAQTLPASMVVSYPPFSENEYDVPRSRSKSSERSRSLPRGHTGPDYGYITYHSPDRSQFAQDVRQGTPDRPNLGPIPENLQIQNGYGRVYEDHDGRARPGHQGHHVPHHHHHRSVSPPVHRSQLPPGDPLRQAISPPPGSISQGYDHFRASGGITAPGAPPQTYVAKGVRANTVISPLRATGPGHETKSSVPNNRHSLAFTPVGDVLPAKAAQRSQSYRVTPDHSEGAHITSLQRSMTPQPSDPETRFRMDKMEEQIASLAAWVQTAVSSTSSRASSVRSTASTTPSDTPGSNTGSVIGSVSDLSSGSSSNTITQNIKDGILTIKQQTADLKLDLRNIRRMNQLNNETLQESIHETMKKIAKALRIVPGAEHQLLRQQRSDVDVKCQRYLENKAKIYKELSDLEAAVEELRGDVISRQCRVNMSDVEAMALMLSNITKAFGDLKVNFPMLQKELKSVMAGEMEVVIKEERFLKDEPDTIDEALKRCKRLTGTLFTLKRLASVQEHRPVHQATSAMVGGRLPSEDDKKALLENIRAMVPDHNARVQSLVAADASRERKKKIVTKQEALKFGKSLEMASKALKSAYPSKEPPSEENLDLVSKETVVKDIACIESLPIISSTTKSTSTHYADATSKPSSIADTHDVDEGKGAKKDGSSHSTSEEDIRRKTAILAIKKDAARAAFFSSLTTPPTSPSEEKRVITSPSATTTTMDYTVRISPIRVTSSGETRYTVTNSVGSKSSQNAAQSSSTSTSKPTSLPVSSKRTSGYKSASPTPSPPTPNYQLGSVGSITARKLSPSSIPRFSTTKVTGDSSEKTSKKMTTSTPISSNISDRTSTVSSKPVIKAKPETAKGIESKKGTDSSSHPIVRPKKVPPPPPPRKSSRLPGGVVPVTTEVSINGAVTVVSPPRCEASKEAVKTEDSSIVVGHAMGSRESGVVCTSTPKSSVLPRPSSKFEKGIVEGMSVASGSNIQYSLPSKSGHTQDSKTETKDLSREDRGSSSDSTASSGSVDSQRGTVVLRCKQPPPKKPKPPPPERKSSLSHMPKEEEEEKGKS